MTQSISSINPLVGALFLCHVKPHILKLGKLPSNIDIKVFNDSYRLGNLTKRLTLKIKLPDMAWITRLNCFLLAY